MYKCPRCKLPQAGIYKCQYCGYDLTKVKMRHVRINIEKMKDIIGGFNKRIDIYHQ
jgi:ribosomal protein L37AE/L43A